MRSLLQGIVDPSGLVVDPNSRTFQGDKYEILLENEAKLTPQLQEYNDIGSCTCSNQGR